MMPRNIIRLFSLMMGAPDESKEKRSCFSFKRAHPNSSYILLIIFKISCSLLFSSASISASSSLRACVCASCSSSFRSIAFFSLSAPSSPTRISSILIRIVSSVIRSSSRLSSLTNLNSLKFCSSASRNVSTSSSISLSPVASFSFEKASWNRSTSALDASYFSVSSCICALCAKSSSLLLAFFASSSSRALTCRFRFSSLSMSLSRLLHSASKSCWCFKSSAL
mmetsp:Transcript_31290/g.76694  ORF Transcript_31290/g.76694 Transcript_31290/m.76694 type:complete len:224 (-) Transcript_31290:820-1491(-)